MTTLDRSVTTNPSGIRLAQARSAFMTQIHVIYALMLHDIKSRYLGNGLGYIVTIVWPAAHLAILMIIFVVTGRLVPYGTSKLLYVSTGVYPFIVWNYVSRFTMMGALQNKGYLNYPIVKPLDLVLSRIVLEINTSFIILIWLGIMLTVLGVDCIPHDPARAATGVLAAMVLGIGFGILGSAFTFLTPFFFIGYVGIILLLYFTSGIIMNPESLPTVIGDYLAWNPLLHCVELVRSAYYPDYPTRLLDARYVFEVGFFSGALGLIAVKGVERYM